MRDQQDAFGHVLRDRLRGIEAREVIERDDGWIASGLDPAFYFAEFEGWPSVQRQAVRYARGKSLDVGCGAGRVALHLQKKGHSVIGIDNSPLAIKVCKERGVKKARLLPFAKVSTRLGTFETVILFGGNFGLFENPQKARLLLKRLRKMTTPSARILAESRDPYKTADPSHLAYHQRNRRRGRMPGQVRIRVRYRSYVTPWWDYLMVSKEEMEEILEGTGWGVRRAFGDQQYVAVLEKESL